MDTNIQKAIVVITEARAAVGDILKDNPELQTRTQHVMGQLINVLAGAGGIHIEMASAPVFKPLKTILGHNVEVAEKASVSEATPTEDEQDDFQSFVDLAYEEFPTGDAKELKGAYNDLVIRAVAKKAGMTDITPTNPAKIDVEFVEQIQALMNRDAELEVKDLEATTKAKTTTKAK